MRPLLCSSLVLHCLLAVGCGRGRYPEEGVPILPQSAKVIPSGEEEHELSANLQPTPPPAPEAMPEGAAKALEALDPFLDKDLSELGRDDKRELAGKTKAVLAKWPYATSFGFHPWHIWKFRADRRTVYWILDYDGPVPHPTSPILRIGAFRGDGKKLAETTFRTGYRCYAHAARLAKPMDPRCPLLILDTSNGVGPGPGIGAQCYALVGDAFALVRLEDPSGSLMRNDYTLQGRECGPAIPKRSASEWEADLLSGDRFRILRALTWLGGVHPGGHVPRYDMGPLEDPDVAKLVQQIREKPRVVARLRRFAGGDDRWVREAALLALEGESDR
jgi:hypothetical protein